jgi:hypothetical protein
MSYPLSLSTNTKKSPLKPLLSPLASPFVVSHHLGLAVWLPVPQNSDSFLGQATIEKVRRPINRYLSTLV